MLRFMPQSRFRAGLLDGLGRVVRLAGTLICLAGVVLAQGQDVEGSEALWAQPTAGLTVAPMVSLTVAPMVSLTVAPMVSICERPGITGAGWAVAYDVGQGATTTQRVNLLYPNHPDDWGKSVGMGFAYSTDSGRSWRAGPDDYPFAGMLDMWQDRLPTGELITFGIRFVPERKQVLKGSVPQASREQYALGISKDQGQTWQMEHAEIHASDAVGVIARPLPRILQDSDGSLGMPAYAWSKTGSRSLWLKSADGGRNWHVASVIATGADMRACNAAPTAPWLETAVERTSDGQLLAAIRTGSSSQSAIVSARSADNGATWSPVQRLLAGPARRLVPGKAPGLRLLPNGVLVLLTAHSKDHCRVYVSADGAGRQWSDGYIVTSQSGGNTSMVAIGSDKLLVITPATGRIAAWEVTVAKDRPVAGTAAVPAPTGIKVVSRGASARLSWLAPVDAVQVSHYLVTPVLLKPADNNQDMEVYPYLSIQTRDAVTQLELGKLLAPGATYRFEVAAVDHQGRISLAASSGEVIAKPL